MKVLFRIDASNLMGTGHVMRCLTLAEALRDRGGEARFICREHPGNLLPLIRQQGFEAVGLPPTPDIKPDHPTDYAAWLRLLWLIACE